MSGVSVPMLKAQPGGSPAQSAMIINANQASSQANLARAVGGRPKFKRGGAVAPQMKVGYTETGAGGQSVNAIMENNAIQQGQGNANAVYDNSARTMKGGTNWGCYSGGRRRRRKYSTKRKSRRKRHCTRKRRKY
jgi:hypothetical protein